MLNEWNLSLTCNKPTTKQVIIIFSSLQWGDLLIIHSDKMWTQRKPW